MEPDELDEPLRPIITEPADDDGLELPPARRLFAGQDRDRLLYIAGWAAAVGVALLVLGVVLRQRACVDCADKDELPEQVALDDVIADRATIGDVIDQQAPTGPTREQLTQLDPVTPEERAAWRHTVVEATPLLPDDEQLGGPSVDPQSLVLVEPAEQPEAELGVKVPDLGEPLGDVAVAVAPQQ
jgi:hypothetical protein